MNEVKAEPGHAVCHNMLFLHAVLGCDTTSCPYGIRKAAPLKKYPESVYFRDQIRVFDADLTPDDVATAGENAVVALYGGSKERASTVSVTADTMSKWLLEVFRCNRRTCPEHRQQLDITASECSCR